MAHEYLRSRNTATGDYYTWKETLQGMCDNYGTFCGRWHSNEFWAKTKTEIPSMNEQQCQDKVNRIEREADGELWYWQMMQ
jgi:hypothetical protein